MTLWGCAFTLALVLSARAAKADDDQSAGNPYTGIVERNMFALVPIPTNPPVDPTPPEPPIKITPNGIMDVFGQLEVIFKAAMPAKGKEAAHDQSYVMAEGERQDDIEVVKIDNKTAVITFINHGIKQDLALANAPSITGPAPMPGGPGGSVPMPRGGPGRGGLNGGNGPVNRSGFGGQGTGPGANPQNNNPGSASVGGTGGAAATANASSADSEAAKLSPEEQVIAIEKERAKLLDAGSSTAALMPTTPLTKQVLGDDSSNQ
jgi:hypothetical protein